MQLEELKRLERQMEESQNQLDAIESEVKAANQMYERYMGLKQRYEMKSVELNAVKQRMQTTATHQLHNEVEELNAKVRELGEKIEESKRTQIESDKKAKDMEAQMRDLRGHRERELKSVEAELKKMKKQSENSRKLWKQREQDFETLKLEVSELQKSVETGKEQLAAGEILLAELVEQSKERDVELNSIKVCSFS